MMTAALPMSKSKATFTTKSMWRADLLILFNSSSADIKDLKIIEEARTEPSEQTHSTVAVTKSAKKGQRATVCENLEANPSHPSKLIVFITVDF